MKDKILKTAKDEFFKHGIQNIAIKNLIEPLGISTKTVYKYFKNKEMLLEQVLKLHYSEQIQLLESQSDEQPVIPFFVRIWKNGFEREKGVNSKFFHDLHKYYPELEKKVERQIGKKIWMHFQRIVDKGIQQGAFLKDTLPEVLMESISVLYIASVRTDQFNKFGTTPFQILQNTVFIFIRGFCTLKGIQELDQHLQELDDFENKSSLKGDSIKAINN